MARAMSGEAKSKIKRASIDSAKKEAKKDIKYISRRDLFMLGLGLYIGEGTKTHDIVRVINANPQVIQLAIKWFKEICGLKEKNFRIRIHMYPDNNEDEWVVEYSDY